MISEETKDQYILDIISVSKEASDTYGKELWLLDVESDEVTKDTVLHYVRNALIRELFTYGINFGDPEFRSDYSDHEASYRLETRMLIALTPSKIAEFVSKNYYKSISLQATAISDLAEGGDSDEAHALYDYIRYVFNADSEFNPDIEIDEFEKALSAFKQRGTFTYYYINILTSTAPDGSSEDEVARAAAYLEHLRSIHALYIEEISQPKFRSMKGVLSIRGQTTVQLLTSFSNIHTAANLWVLLTKEGDSGEDAPRDGILRDKAFDLFKQSRLYPQYWKEVKGIISPQAIDLVGMYLWNTLYRGDRGVISEAFKCVEDTLAVECGIDIPSTIIYEARGYLTSC